MSTVENCMTTDSYKNNEDSSYVVFTILCENNWQLTITTNDNFCCAINGRPAHTLLVSTLQKSIEVRKRKLNSPGAGNRSI